MNSENAKYGYLLIFLVCKNKLRCKILRLSNKDTFDVTKVFLVNRIYVY